MRILFLGDIMGRSGREAVDKQLPALKSKLKPDVIIINGENAAHGIGITEKICTGLYDLGTDVITTGNHVWDQREIIPYIDRDPKLLRPLNFPDGAPGKGSIVHELEDGRRILVANFMTRLFMDAMDDPFAAANELLKKHRLGQNVDAVFFDLHGEATSEKMAFGHCVDGRVSAVVGTHTHVPTADCQILAEGSAYQTDAGMTGDYNSVIGVQKDVPLTRFTKKMPAGRMVPADDEATVCGTFIVTNDNSGLAKFISPVIVGPRLQNVIPEI